MVGQVDARSLVGRFLRLKGSTSSGGLLLCFGLGQYPHDVALFRDEVLDAIDLDLGARPLAEQHPVADLDVDRNELSALVAPTRSDGDDPALLRLFLCRVGDNNAAGGFLLSIDTGEHDTIVKRAELHETFSCRVDTSEIRVRRSCQRRILNRTLYADVAMPLPLAL